MLGVLLMTVKLTRRIELHVALAADEQPHFQVPPLVVLLVAPCDEFHRAELAPVRLLSRVDFQVVFIACIVAEYQIAVLALVFLLLICLVILHFRSIGFEQLWYVFFPSCFSTLGVSLKGLF